MEFINMRPEVTLIRNPEWKRKRRRPENTLRRELKADIKRMNSNWEQLGSIVQYRVGWRMLVGCLCLYMRVTDLDHPRKPKSNGWRSHAKPNVLGSKSYVRDRGYVLLRSPILGQNGRPVIPGFLWWSSLNRLMNSTIKLKQYLFKDCT
ncbi:unnamed protein product [Schistosoma margrebowiei]|uniref:Uncharacterized protein n=1 Tax=Schistosoma margrebowiei TaxID=48269 RepID=A0A183N806_9TREM|nr:unnamed protein product [Schistosoma margrebowiei]